MEPTRLVVDQDVPDGRETIHHLLINYNLRNGPPPNFQLLGILLKDDAGRTIGGLWGRSAYEWLFVELLFVPDELRGQGLGSYQKLGYTIFGELKDHPRGISQYWLQRRFDT
jgi:hypothetical protein